MPSQHNRVAFAREDGKLDLGFGQGMYADTTGVWLGNGDGTFRPEQSFTSSYSAYYVAIGDFVGHGPRDLVVTNLNNGSITVLLRATSSTLPSN